MSADPRYFTLGDRVNSGFAISALSASDILVPRYKEPGTYSRVQRTIAAAALRRERPPWRCRGHGSERTSGSLGVSQSSHDQRG